MMLLLILIIHYFLLGIYFIFYIKYVLLLKGKALHYDVILTAEDTTVPEDKGRQCWSPAAVQWTSSSCPAQRYCFSLVLVYPVHGSRPYCRQHRTTGGVVYWTLLHRGERLNTLLLMEVERLPDSCHEVWTPPCNKYTFQFSPSVC